MNRILTPLLRAMVGVGQDRRTVASGVDPWALEHVVVDCGSGEWRVCPHLPGHRKRAKIPKFTRARKFTQRRRREKKEGKRRKEEKERRNDPTYGGGS